MKRLLVALGMLIAVAALCFFSIHIQASNSGYLLACLDEMEESFERQDYAACRSQADTFVKEFESRTRSFTYFLRHADISRIEEVAVPLPVLLKQGDLEHFAAELVRCRSLLETLYEGELPLPQNIL